ncbi:hypothetical protein EW026_g596 [Hermanssonia centrifuga]|uniref:Uncharacterized protein n=2 Tax=Hermanssonia centrifuga TaxID=98765 RepID=A0A4S4KUK4_9APHY|nr:hypothetical protein EW026_g596 [Hermanssonia centrifuga]
MSHSKRIALFAFIALNVALAVWKLQSISNLRRSAEIDFTYGGGDYPVFLALPPMEPVAMSLQETSHYSLDLNDTISDDEWRTILNLTDGSGRVHLGPERRTFIVSYFHQLHCLRILQMAIAPNPHAPYHDVVETSVHVQHCLNYLRQMLLCTAADSLEKGDYKAKGFEPGTLGDDLVCMDWEALLGIMQSNYGEFVQWKYKWN